MWLRSSVNIVRRLSSSSNASVAFSSRLRCRKCLPKKPLQQKQSFYYPMLATYSTNRINEDQLRKHIDELGDKFTEARELLDDARESEGTVYFSEDMTEAEAAVTETIQDYQSLLLKLDEKQVQEVTRTIGLRMEELKAQLELIKESLKD